MNWLTYILMALLAFPIWTISSKHAVDPKLLVGLVAFPVVLLWKINLNGENSDGKTTIPAWIAIALLFYWCIQWIVSSYQYYATRNLLIFGASFLSFLIGIRYLHSEKAQESFINGLLLISVLASVYALGEYTALIPPMDKSAFFPPHISGHVGHKNLLGFILMTAMPFSMYRGVNTKKKRWFGIAFLLLLTLIISDSRASLGIAVLGMVVWLVPVLVKSVAFSTLKGRILIYGVLLIGLLIPSLFWGEQEWYRVIVLVTGEGDLFRKAVFSSQVSMISESPLIGHGLASFIHESIAYLPDFFKDTNSFTHTAKNGHNEYLEIFTEFGVLGGALYFYFWFGAIILGIKNVLKSRTARDWTWLVALVLMMVHASVSVASKRPPTAFLLWFVMAYFWCNTTSPQWNIAFSDKMKSYGTLGVSLISLVLLALFGQTVLSDFYMHKAFAINSITDESYSYIEKSLKIQGKHPYALYEAARVMAKASYYENAHELTNLLLEVGPYLSPVNTLKGEVYLAQEVFDSARIYLEKDLLNAGGHFYGIQRVADLYEITGQCDSLRLLQQDLFRTHYSFLLKASDKSKIESKYLSALGGMRSKFVGNRLREFYFENYRRVIDTRQEKKYENIMKVLQKKCDD